MKAEATFFSSPLMGLDIGGTKIAGGLLDFPAGRVIYRRQIPTQPIGNPEEFARKVETFVDQLLMAAEAADVKPKAIGLGLCELVGADGIIASAHTLPWLNFDVAAILCRFGPVALEADVRASALAESFWGAGKNLRSFLFIGIGTGISCCLVQNGVPWKGEHGFAGTFASAPIPNAGDQAGVLEDLCSGPALVKRFQAAGERAEKAEEIFAAAEKGSAQAGELLREAGATIGQAIGWLVNVVDPGAVILGGGIGQAGGEYGAALEKAMRGQIWSPLHRAVPLRRAQCGADAGWMGAAASAAIQIFPSQGNL